MKNVAMLGDKQTPKVPKKKSKPQGESHSYDSNRPKKQVVSRYAK